MLSSMLATVTFVDQPTTIAWWVGPAVLGAIAVVSFSLCAIAGNRGSISGAVAALGLGAIGFLTTYATVDVITSRAETGYRSKVLQVVQSQWPVSDIRDVNWSPDDSTAAASFFAVLHGTKVTCLVHNTQNTGVVLRCSPWPMIPTDPQTTLPLDG